jgi:hypothetical protein
MKQKDQRIGEIRKISLEGSPIFVGTVAALVRNVVSPLGAASCKYSELAGL